jgi:cysteine desulfurase
MIYLDWAATSLPYPDIIDRVREAEKEYFGNPSSIHKPGRNAKKLLIQSREILAHALKAQADEIVFTSGGTESNNSVLFSLLVRSAWKGTYKKKIIISSIEHPSVHKPAKVLQQLDYEVVFIPPDPRGIIDPGKIAEAVDPRTVLVSCMYVNNETGAVQPIKEISTIVRESAEKNGRTILFHVDAVQGFGKLPFYPHELGIDTASLSGHKIGGSKGCGALFIRKGLTYGPLFRGGGQEGKQRPGTENTAGIYSLALCAERAVTAMESHRAQAEKHMRTIIAGLKTIEGTVFIPGLRENAGNDLFSPYILKVSFPEIPGEVIVRMLEDKGIMVSTGSACSSQKKKGRHRVLKNMGISEETAESSVRISTGYSTTEEDIETLVAALKILIPDLKKIM